MRGDHAALFYAAIVRGRRTFQWCRVVGRRTPDQAIGDKRRFRDGLRGEIIRPRRRVNALEYVLIPHIEHDIKAVQMKLDEMERSNLSRLMRIKTVVRRQPDEATAD
jgi:hypothetical protein